MLPPKIIKNELAKIQPTTHLIQCLTNDDKDKSIEIAVQEKSLTLAKTLHTVHISEIEKEVSQKQLLLAVREIIINSARAFKYAENMNYGTATLLAGDLLEKFKNDSIEDIVLMLKMARQGELGSTKGRLDADVLNLILIPNYLLYKADLREKIYRKEEAERKKLENENIVPIKQEYIDKLDAIYNSFGVDTTVEKPTENHHEMYIERLRKDVINMPLELLEQRKRDLGNQAIFREAVQIIEEEIKIRTS